MGSTAITETSNELTVDMDIASPSSFLRLLRQSDAQLFAGYKEYAGLYDSEILSTLTSLIQSCISSFSQQKDEEGKEGKREKKRVRVVMSGAGTSGRIAFFVARAFNLFFPSSSFFHYLIAGGDKALIVGQEGSEDDVKAAVVDLKKVIEEGEGGEADTIIFIGITCGLSAPYVAAQFDYLFKLADEGKKGVISVLMGFNPVSLARKNMIEHWHRSFFDIAQEMQKRSNIQHTFF